MQIGLPQSTTLSEPRLAVPLSDLHIDEPQSVEKSCDAQSSWMRCGSTRSPPAHPDRNDRSAGYGSRGTPR